MTTAMRERIAGAPITWGVCEVPGWGHQLPSERVLGEMRQLGLDATEVGPDGFLPDDPVALRSLLEEAGMRPVGAFVPVVLHDRERMEDELARVGARASDLAAAGASVLVLAVSTGREGYEGEDEIDAQGWRRLGEALDRAAETAREQGVLATVHPHHGTVVETQEEVDRVLELSGISLCLDTGHLVVGGSEPASIAARSADRVGHVHLKDVDAEVADGVRAGAVGYRDAVAGGLYRRLGEGDADIAGTVHALERGGYEGWYVLEQDTVLPAEPEPGVGPVEDARASIAFLERLGGGIVRQGDLRSAVQDRA